MDTILIAGIESLVGANLAATLSHRYRIVGLSASTQTTIADCETAVCNTDDANIVREWVASIRPAHIVDCSSAAHFAWQSPSALRNAQRALHSARNWASASHEFGCRLTLISSDALFTGPWMFHGEKSTSFCDSLEAQTLRTIEDNVGQLSPQALIVRTHAFGWSPHSNRIGWLEQTLNDLEQQTASPYDCTCYATPILATELAELIDAAWQRELDGCYHIAGAERVNLAQFVRWLAHEFDHPAPATPPIGSLSERPTGFGRGETSLQTSKIRNALGRGMPMLSESLMRLREQTVNGYRDRLQVEARRLEEQVA